MKLTGKVAIVTGSAQGIGKAMAMKLASEGAAVVVCDINIEGAHQVVDEIKNQGGAAIALEVDVTNKESVQNLVENTLESFKAIHILVNNAGITRNKYLLKMTEEDWDAVLAVDLKGVFLCTQAVLGYMMEQQYGKIINISSIAGVERSIAGAVQANYAAAKAGVIQLTKVAARAGGPYGINVNSIAPGVVVTDMTYAGRTKEQVEKLVEKSKELSVLQRVGSPQDIANLALFLASDDSSFITGQVICCDGGHHDRL